MSIKKLFYHSFFVSIEILKIVLYNVFTRDEMNGLPYLCYGSYEIYENYEKLRSLLSACQLEFQIY